MTDNELRTIGEVIRDLPAFEDFDETRLSAVACQCVEILSLQDGLATLLEDEEAVRLFGARAA